jgi:tetratricopeptide (TPR) repeat protein
VLLYKKEGKLDKAIEMHRKVFDIKKKTIGEVHLSVADTLNNMSLALEEQGRQDEAIETYQK